MPACNDAHSELTRKRCTVQDNSGLAQDDIPSLKRPRASSTSNEEIKKESVPMCPSSVHNEVSLNNNAATTEDEEPGPVQQLVGMFGALVAQGNKAAKSLEVLISSISSDLLAEVVIANIRYLPPSCPKINGDEEVVPSVCSVPIPVTNKLPPIQPSTVVSDPFSLSSAFPLISSLLNIQPATSQENDVS